MPEKNNDKKNIRNRIRQQIEEEFNQKQKQYTSSSGSASESDEAYQTRRAEYLKRYIKEYTAEEVYGAYPEFIRCENHLGDHRWLTPFELLDEHEFFPEEKPRWKKFKRRLFTLRRVKIPDSKPFQEYWQKCREEFEADARERIALYEQKMEEARRHRQNEMQQKIYEEERDRFYKKQAGYKKYYNHLGETRWLTQDEFEKQDEFVEDVSARYRRWLLRIAIVILPIAAGLFFWAQQQGNGVEPKSYVIVESNDQRAHLYVDHSLAVGFVPGKPYPLKPGEHDVYLLRQGYVSEPKQMTVDLTPDDTVRLAFELKPRSKGEHGYIRVKSSLRDAGVFVDGNFLGTLAENRLFDVAIGEHRLVVERDGYRPRPSQYRFDIQSSDTLEFTFRWRAESEERRSVSGTGEATKYGIVEVTSNVKNAEILLNGNTTGKKTDYILQEIPLGSHRISLQKKGYRTYPEERVVKITQEKRRHSLAFTLTSTVQNVEIVTRPVDGEIFIDGKSLGSGLVQASLPLGEHRLTFGPVEHYKAPEPKTIEVTLEGNHRYVFQYESNFYLLFSPNAIKPDARKASVNKGYIRGDRSFRLRETGGVDVIHEEKISEDIWYMGFAYQYRNPPGADALQFNFSIPESVDLSDPVYLKVWGYRTKDNYPLTISGKTSYAIWINGLYYREELSPAYSRNEISDDNFDRFVVNDYLRNGNNQIIIHSVERASAYFALWKIRLEQ